MPKIASKILGPNGRPFRRERAERVSVYDAAQTTEDNSRHWIAADALSAKSANSLAVRRTLRQRARYEAQQNNSYAKGICLTLSNDLVGTGPRLQVLLEDDRSDSKAARQVERAFSEWARSIELADKLRTMKMAKTIDGETFALLTTNPGLMTSVKLDLRVIECDLVTDPLFAQAEMNVIDGVKYDEYGNPSSYYLLNEHPGDVFTSMLMGGHWEKAANVIHWFRRDRPGQVRGIPEITPALPLFAELRRYLQAVIAAAESAADFSAVLESQFPPDDEDDDTAAVPMDSIEIRKRMMTTLPNGFKLSQLRPEQPATTLEMFVWVCMREIARCLNMPLNVALGDSSKSNYASGRLDYQLYRKSIKVEESHCEMVVLCRIVQAWLNEAVMIPGLLPAGFDIENMRHRFFWDGWEHVDPSKEGTGDQLDIGNRTKSRTEICAERGRDWEEEVLPQLAKEEAALKAAGLDAAPPSPAPASEPDEGEAMPEDGQEEPATPAPRRREEQVAVAVAQSLSATTRALGEMASKTTPPQVLNVGLSEEALATMLANLAGHKETLAELERRTAAKEAEDAEVNKQVLQRLDEATARASQDAAMAREAQAAMARNIERLAEAMATPAPAPQVTVDNREVARALAELAKSVKKQATPAAVVAQKPKHKWIIERDQFGELIGAKPVDLE